MDEGKGIGESQEPRRIVFFPLSLSLLPFLRGVTRLAYVPPAAVIGRQGGYAEPGSGPGPSVFSFLLLLPSIRMACNHDPLTNKRLRFLFNGRPHLVQQQARSFDSAGPPLSAPPVSSISSALRYSFFFCTLEKHPLERAKHPREPFVLRPQVLLSCPLRRESPGPSRALKF